ncbi:MAG: sodium:calcium antiporter [Candidatus Staskawiczbacteria bacterium]
MIIQILVLIVSCFVLSWLSTGLIKTLIDIAKFLKLREFMIGFFVMAFATSLPNFFIGVSSALRGMPELSFGDVMGGNLVDLTLAIALAGLLCRKALIAKSDMVQNSAIFTAVIAILPLLLVFDGTVSRIDGVILLLAFTVYTFWIFSKQERFTKVYEVETAKKKTPIFSFQKFLKDIFKFLGLIALLLLTSQIVIGNALYFSESLGISISMVGILIVGLGNCFPEIYFSIISSRKGENWMVLGNLMGSVIVCSTLVLGTVAIICPIRIFDFSPFLTARIFLICAVLVFLFAMRTGKKIDKKESLLLLSIYILFLITEIFIKF